MINNLERIKPILVFDSDDDFYHLQILKRKKEHPELGSNTVVVKTYYISSLEYLEKKFDEIKALADHHNARACINLNRRSFEKMAFQLLKKVSDQIMNRDYRSARKAYESVCGAHSNETNKKWIIDIDTKDRKVLADVVISIMGIIGEKAMAVVEDNCKKINTNFVYAEIPTKNGCHLITIPFNLSEFKKQFPEIDVHKDNPTIIYMP